MDAKISCARVTMQQIAETARVSKMTVSRALKDHPHLKAATKQRIRKIARKLGYHPHPYISALMSHLSQTGAVDCSVVLAVVHFSSEADTRAHPYLQGIEDRAKELGYEAALFRYQAGKIALGRLRRIFVARGIRGIILMPAAEGFSSLDFDFSGFAVAALGHSITSPPLPRVGNDIHAGVLKALNELTKRGYRRVGLINSPHVNALSRFMYSGALQAYRAHLAEEIDVQEYSLENLDNGSMPHPEIAAWIRQTRRDVIMSSSFDFPLYDHLRTMKFAIPGELGYLHLLNHPNPEVASLNVMGEFSGAKAVDMVVASINRNEFNPSKHPYLLAIEPGWHPGSTLRGEVVLRHPPVREPDLLSITMHPK